MGTTGCGLLEELGVNATLTDVVDTLSNSVETVSDGAGDACKWEGVEIGSSCEACKFAFYETIPGEWFNCKGEVSMCSEYDLDKDTKKVTSNLLTEEYLQTVEHLPTCFEGRKRV